MREQTRMKNPVQNFAQGEAGKSRDKVAERLDWARRLEQVERLKAKERMVTSTGGANPRPVENFPQGEVGITPTHAGTDIQENFPGSELVPFPE